jgi:IBR domain, a half RING-finger domain
VDTAKSTVQEASTWLLYPSSNILLIYRCPIESNPEWNCLSCSKRHCYICKEDISMPCEHLTAIDAQKRTQILAKKKSALRIFSESAKRAEEAQHRARENLSGTNRKIAETTKKCPKAGCPNKIERKSGCGHFTCAMCRTEFCWCCKVIWKDTKPLHLVGCRIGTKSQVERHGLDLSEYKPGWDQDTGYDLNLDDGLWLVNSHM